MNGIELTLDVVVNVGDVVEACSLDPEGMKFVALSPFTGKMSAGRVYGGD